MTVGNRAGSGRTDLLGAMRLLCGDCVGPGSNKTQLPLTIAMTSDDEPAEDQVSCSLIFGSSDINSLWTAVLLQSWPLLLASLLQKRLLTHQDGYLYALVAGRHDATHLKTNATRQQVKTIVHLGDS